MDYTITPYHLFATACLAYMLAGLFCAYTRWHHLCRPFDQEPDYYYPGRRQVTFFFAAQILQFPYLLGPGDADTWLYVRIFGILYYPLCFLLLINRYFRKQQLLANRVASMAFVVAFAFLISLLAVVLLPGSRHLARYEMPVLWTSGVISLMLMTCLLQMVLWLKRKIDSYHHNFFSNDEDFPFRFAKSSLPGVLVWVSAMGYVFVAGNPWVKFVCDIAFTLWQVFFLTRILHPQFAFRIPADSGAEAIDEAECAVDTPEPETLATGELACQAEAKVGAPAEVRELVLEVMLQKYKNPHLQKSEVLEAIPRGMKREANAFILQVGYYNLVNMFRLQHATLYRRSKPSATQDDIAEASGFTTRFAFYRARKHVESINPDLVCGVVL